MSRRRSSRTRSAGSIAIRSVLLALVLVASGCGAGEEARSTDRTADTPASSGSGTSAAPADADGSTSSLDTPAADNGASSPDRTGVERATDRTSEDSDAAVPDEGDTTPSDPEPGGPDSEGEEPGKDGAEDPAGDAPDGDAADRTGPMLAQVDADDSGEDVVALQERLAELGFDPGAADGHFGRRTKAALHTFQEVAELPPTGRADRRTVEALASFRYDGLALVAGDEGDEVEELQRRLAAGPFDPGPVDGVYGSATVAAVWALEKLANVPVDGNWGPVDELAWQRLLDGRIGQPERRHDQRWVEVDLSQQLMKVYDPGSTAPVLISHASSGSGIPWENEDHSGSSVTPRGDFHINRRISGWRESSLDIGRLYNPLYFNGGIAFHGATSVPLYPASHGCIRLPMHIADYLPGELPNGTPVHVLA